MAIISIDSLNGNGSIWVDGEVVNSQKFGIDWTILGSFYLDNTENSIVSYQIEKDSRKIIVQEDDLYVSDSSE